MDFRPDTWTCGSRRTYWTRTTSRARAVRPWRAERYGCGAGPPENRNRKSTGNARTTVTSSSGRTAPGKNKVVADVGRTPQAVEPAVLTRLPPTNPNLTLNTHPPTHPPPLISENSDGNNRTTGIGILNSPHPRRDLPDWLNGPFFNV